MNFNTDVGRIFCKYNKDRDDFDKVRLLRITSDNGHDDEKMYIMAELEDEYPTCHFKMNEDGSVKSNMITEDEFISIKKEYTALTSEGIMAISNIVSVENETNKIEDVLAIFYPNHKISGVPDVTQPYIVARQGIDNIFSMDMFGDVGMSVSLDTVPVGYSLYDFMVNTSVTNSILGHVYKTDNAEQLEILFQNEKTCSILEELFMKQYNFRLHTARNFEPFKPNKDSMMNGYCMSIKNFLESTGFMDDLFEKIGIIRVDFPMEYSTPLDLDQKLLCAMLLGGVRIDNAVPLMFDYTINMNAIKMKYFLAEDSNNILWIVPYTESPDEVDPKVLYDLTEERTTTIQNRLANVIRAYDESVKKDKI